MAKQKPEVKHEAEVSDRSSSFFDSGGHVAPSFTGEEYVRSNDCRSLTVTSFGKYRKHFRFAQVELFSRRHPGEPIEDKAGEWRIRTWLDGELVTDRTLRLVL